MATSASSGSSTLAETPAAITQAITEAAARMPAGAPLLGLLFVSPKHDLGAALAAASLAAPKVEFLACSTAGEITEAGLTHGGVSVMLVATDDFLWDIGVAEGLSVDPARAAETLADGYSGRLRDARGRGWGLSTTLLLMDGLTGSEAFIEALQLKTRLANQIVGGGAGDEGALKETRVGAKGRSMTNGAVALHLVGRRQCGVGVGHGLRPNSPKMQVTRATHNVVHEIDRRPALDVYREHAAKVGVELTPETTGKFLVENELGLFAGTNLYRVRAPIATTPDGSVVFAGEVSTGASVCLMTGDQGSMVEAARSAAIAARESLAGAPAAGVLLFSCICRGLLLGANYQQEIDAVRSVFPDVPIAGLLSYGEVARSRGSLDGYHNNTLVVAAIPG